QFFDPDPTLAPQDRWRTIEIHSSFADAEDLYPLDARYENVQPGTRMLLLDNNAGTLMPLVTAVITDVVDQNATLRTTVASPPPATLGNRADTVTHVRLRQTIRGRPAAVETGALPWVLARSGAGPLLIFDGNTAVPVVWSSPDFVAASDVSLV